MYLGRHCDTAPPPPPLFLPGRERGLQSYQLPAHYCVDSVEPSGMTRSHSRVEVFVEVFDLQVRSHWQWPISLLELTRVEPPFISRNNCIFSMVDNCTPVAYLVLYVVLQ